MPRVYTPKPGAKIRKKYNKLIIKEALDELSGSDASLKSVAQKYGISKSVLGRHKLQEMKSSGGQTALSAVAEEYIIQNLNTCAEWGYPLTTLDLRYVVKMYLDTLGIQHKRFKNNLPGPDFADSFLKRHKNNISKRICQNIKRARAKVSPQTIKEYHLELEKSIANVPLSNIINYDETNLTDDPGRKQVIVKRGCKYPERVMNHTKGSVSLMMAATADGETLPPYVVYKATHLYNTWITNGPKNARYNRSASGWFDGGIFADWIKTMVIPMLGNKPGKKVLIGDNLSSHLSADLIKLCKDKAIHFVFLPANSTHLTQPLDVAYFRPMKTAWRQILEKWKNTDGRTLSTIPKGCFPRLLKLLIEQLYANSENNVKAGFRKTGIAPLDVNVILARLPKDNNEADKDAIDHSFINLLKEMRFGTMHIQEPKNKRKLLVVAGRSVSGEDTEAAPAIKKKKLKTTIRECPSTSEKGKGIGKKTKKYLSSKVNTEIDTNKNIQPQEIDIDSLDITQMQVILADDLDSSEVKTTKAEKIISEEAATKLSEEDKSMKEQKKCSNGADMKEWVRLLTKNFSFPHVKVMYPTAPLQPYTPAGGQMSNVWFDREYIVPNVPEKSDSIAKIETAVRYLIQKENDDGIPINRIVVGGFSMGGALALHTGYRFDRNVAGVFAFSSFLNEKSAVYQDLKNVSGVKLPPLLQIHGDNDEMVDPKWGKSTFNELESLGVRGEFHIMERLGHSINKRGMNYIKDWVMKVVPES